jgi:heme oxygenase
VLEGIEHIARASNILKDMVELENEYNILRHIELLCPVVAQYVEYVMELEDNDDILAHIYVRHFGDMYGGQMIKKRQPGSGTMYDFENVEELKPQFVLCSTMRWQMKQTLALNLLCNYLRS